jgi:protein-S-isoprenylcysteine O-methyltransferase Ste14
MAAGFQDYLILIAIWGGWCFLHSFLISFSVLSFMETRFVGYERWYRIFYNIFSLLTLGGSVCYLKLLDSPVLFSWQGGWNLLRFSLLLLALILFREGAKKYRLTSFLGLDQLKTGHRDVLLNGKTVFSRNGVLGIIRHPWYGGSILLVWSGLQIYSVASTLVAALLSLYLIIGTLLEEKKLLAEYGDDFQLYREEVSMLFPWKWLRGHLF